MKQKVVKLEISKLIAIMIAVVAIAFAAGFFVQGSYFQGMAGGGGAGTEKIMEQNNVQMQKQVLKQEVNKLKGLLNNPNFNKLNFEKAVMQFESSLVDAKVAPELTDKVVSELMSEEDTLATAKTAEALDDFSKSLTDLTITDSVQKLDADLKAL